MDETCPESPSGKHLWARHGITFDLICISCKDVRSGEWREPEWEEYVIWGSDVDIPEENTTQ